MGFYVRKYLIWRYLIWKDIKSKLHTLRKDYITELQPLISMIESGFITLFIIGGIILLACLGLLYPKYQSLFWPALSFYSGSVLSLTFSQRFNIYKNLNKYRNGKTEIVENDALYALLEASQINYDKSIKEDIALWKYEPDSKKKKAVMNKILDKLNITKIFKSESLHKDHALTNPAFNGMLIDYISKHTVKKSRIHIKTVTEKDYSDTDDNLKVELSEFYGLSISLLNHRFRDFNKAFKDYSTNYLTKRPNHKSNK